MKKLLLLLFIIMLLPLPVFASQHKSSPATAMTVLKQEKTCLGIDRVGEPTVDAIFVNQRVGVFSNQSGINSRLENSIDVLLNKYNVTAIFTPEHGLLGAVAAGENYSDEKYKNITVYSLYGETRRPRGGTRRHVRRACSAPQSARPL